MNKNYKDIVTKKFLQKEYIKNGKTIKDLSKETGFHTSTIRSYLKKYNFQIKRNISWKKDDKRRLNIIGKKFGCLKVLAKGKIYLSGNCKWKCICNCGNIFEIQYNYIKQNRKNCHNCRFGENNKCFKGYKGIHKTIWTRLIKNAECRNLEFNISMKYAWKLFLNQKQKCALSDVDIKFSKTTSKKVFEMTASLDRIDSNKGYIKGNVWWVHKDVNFMKQEYTVKYFIEMCRNIARKNTK